MSDIALFLHWRRLFSRAMWCKHTINNSLWMFFSQINPYFSHWYWYPPNFLGFSSLWWGFCVQKPFQRSTTLCFLLVGLFHLQWLELCADQPEIRSHIHRVLIHSYSCRYFHIFWFLLRYTSTRVVQIDTVFELVSPHEELHCLTVWRTVFCYYYYSYFLCVNSACWFIFVAGFVIPVIFLQDVIIV